MFFLFSASPCLRGEIFRFLIEPLAAETKYAIGTRPIILPGNRPTQFYELRSGEALAQPLAQTVGHLGRRGRHCICQFQHQLLVGIKQVAFAMPVKIADLLFTQACRLTCGRVDVNSKRTLNQLGRSNLSQDLQLGRNQVHFIQRLAELRIRDQEIRMRCNGLHGSNVPSQTLTHELADDLHFDLLKHSRLAVYH